VIGLRAPLDRTLLLMRDELRASVSDTALLTALTSTEIALVADAETLVSPAAQTAFVSTALLCVRSGHKVYLLAPDVDFAVAQPPPLGTRLIGALLQADGHIVPARRLVTQIPDHEVDLEIRLGSSPSVCKAKAQLTMTATPWSVVIERGSRQSTWPGDLTWPIGAMAGSTLAAAEAFKCTMRKLVCFAREAALFTEFFRPLEATTFTLAPASTAMHSDLGMFDLVSGGAITNGTLYALSRLPQVRGIGRVIEPDIAEITNLNRYMLLLTDHLGGAKANHLAGLDLGSLTIKPLPWRFKSKHSLGALGPRVLVGVDHIPTRWTVQRARPRWLGIGATTHWSAMASCHSPATACAGCAHPRDDTAEGAIPTVAFVSFMAALLQTTYFLRELTGDSMSEQLAYVTLPRAEKIWRSPVARRPGCPVCHAAVAA
jgi:hypothetical protein